MSAFKKIAGLAVGVTAVGVLGVALAQGQPPDARIPNHAIGAGQQSPHHLPMGETGVYAWEGEMRTATLQKEAEVAQVVQEPTPVAQAEPAPMVVQAEPAPSTTAMLIAVLAVLPKVAMRVVAFWANCSVFMGSSLVEYARFSAVPLVGTT